MTGWRQRWGGLFGGRATPARAERTAPPGVPAEAAVAIAVDEEVALAEPSVDVGLRDALFDWVTGTASTLSDVTLDGERRLLARMDAVLASADSRAALLPRAPAVIPQLLNSLRNEGESIASLAERVMRDPHLVAEVIRLSNSAQAAAAEPIVDISHAIARIGTSGLRRAIARVVLKPMFGGSADTLSARSAPRLWEHTEALATACQREAVARGLDPFEGYLAGLMHDVGWTAALRAIDRCQSGMAGPFSRAFVAEFEPRRERFFALLVIPWRLTAGLTALGIALRDGDLAGSPLGEALRAANLRAARQVLASSLRPAMPPA